MTRLRVDDAGEALEIPLDADRLVFGRLETCDVQLGSTGVSRQHAALERTRGGWTIADLGSRNGTFVNEEPVERRALRAGDVVRLGSDVTFTWPSPGAEPAAAPRGAETPARAAGGAHAPGARPAAPAAGEGGGRGFASWLRQTLWHLTPRSSAGRAATVRADRTTVGRDPGAGLVLDDESVSRMHARLDRRSGALVVTDLKSSNGTFVNGESVLSAPLRDGDHVRFGDVEYAVSRSDRPAWGRIAGALVAVLAVTLGVAGLLRLGDVLSERSDLHRMAEHVRADALDATRQGIESARAGDAELARAHLLYAADLLLLADLAPRGSSLERPEDVFHDVVPALPEGDRDFDFAKALDPSTIEASQAKLATLTNREYVDHQIRRYSVELGQDANVPPGFVDQVWGFVQDYSKYRGSMESMLRRSRDVQPRIRAVLAQAHLPESFCYVAWVESELDPGRRSPAGALGLWQLMPAVALEYHLRVNDANPAADDRTNIERSTGAAAGYISSMLRIQGIEQFMIVLASYNRGPHALDRAKLKIDDPTLGATRKYWYLVENQLLPEETRNYVPKIFAVRIVAEAPERFGYRAP